jgi:MFS family permease
MLAGMFNIFNMLEANVFLPYLYTRVHCCSSTALPLSEHYDIRELLVVAAIRDEAKQHGFPLPKSAQLGGTDGGGMIPACDVPNFPTSSKQWSLSPFCTNRAFVEDTAQNVVGLNGPLQKVAGLAVLPIGGTIADSMGRKPVLMAYALALTMACLLYALDSAVESSRGDMGLYIAGMLLCVSWDPKDNVINGAVSDLVTGEVDKGRAFAFISAFNSVGMVFGFLAAFFCLRMHLENYLVPWLFFAAVGLCIYWLLVFGFPETFPAHLRTPVSQGMLNPVNSLVHNLSLLARDKVLIGVAALNFLLMFHFVGFITLSFSYLLLVGFSMEEAVLPGVVGSVAQVIWSGAVVFALPKLGVWPCYILGHVMFVVAYCFWGPYTALVGHHGPYFGNMMQAAGFAFMFPAMQAIISQRVEKDNQSKCFSAVSTVSTLGIMLGMPCYSEVIFDGMATGIMRAVPSLVSACFALLGTLLAVALSCVARAEAPASKEAGERDLDK